MRMLAFGDLHGCLEPFDALLAWVAPTPDDLVITLGDYVDRGPDSRGVLDRLLQLNQHLNLTCLRGNHEQIMVEAYRGGRAEKKMWLGIGGVQTLGSYGPDPTRVGLLEDIPKEHWDFLGHQLVDSFETERFIFVHATVQCDRPLAEQTCDALLWEFLPDQMQHQSGKLVVCGHSSQRSGLPKVIPGAVCIDTQVYASGWLTCLDVDSGRFWQADMLGRQREGSLQYLV